MDLLAELILRSVIIKGIGTYSRYYFFILIGKKKDLDYLTGDKVIDDSINAVQQPFYNAAVGIILFIIICLTIAYLVYS